ncbi:MAG: hypothetical protein R2795_21700 [Saprospiraceae bacterium]
MITSFDQLDLNKTYSYADYLTWQFSERVELFRGRVFRMSPAPNRRHQEISIELAALIFHFLKKKNVASIQPRLTCAYRCQKISKKVAKSIR